MLDVIKQIAKKNNLLETFYSAKSGFNGNRVFLSDNHVIKIFDESDYSFYKNEVLVYKNLERDYISKLIDTGIISNTNYILITKIDAIPLYSIWDTLSDSIKENIIYQISNILKDINKLPIESNINFKEYLITNFYNWYNKLNISEDLSKEILSFFKLNIDKFEDNQQNYIIYYDNHFDNFLYSDGKVYVIDFEDLRVGNLDYQLDIWNRMSKYPRLFSNEEDEKKIMDINYHTLTKSIKKYYQEMFNFENLEDRLKIYSLIYDIRIIVKYGLNEEQLRYRLNEELYGNIIFSDK